MQFPRIRQFAVAGVAAALALTTTAAAPAESDSSAQPAAAHTIQRLHGDDRYLASTATITNAFNPAQVDKLYVTTGKVHTDALAAAGVSAGDPVVLVSGGTVLPETEIAVAAMKPQQIVVVGGPDSVGKTTLDKLKRYAPNGVIRIDGKDRYQAAANASKYAYPNGSSTVYVTTGTDEMDATRSAVAIGLNQGPLLFTQNSRLVHDTRSELVRLKPDRIVVIGDKVENRVLTELRKIAPTVRRTTTQMYAERARAHGVDHLVLATDRVWSDAITAIGLSDTATQVHMVPQSGLSAEVRGIINESKPAKVTVVGGPVSISNNVINEVRGLLPGAVIAPAVDVQPGDSPYDGDLRPVIVLNPHQDDETLTMVPDLLRIADQDRDIIFVQIMDGTASSVINQINNQLVREGYDPITPEEMGEGRDRELAGALAQFGISEDLIVHWNLKETNMQDPNGSPWESEIRKRLRALIAQYPDAEVMAMHEVDVHPDHQVVGSAARKNRLAGEVPGGVAYYPHHRNMDEILSNGTPRVRQLPVTQRVRDAFEAARQEYALWDPQNGRYNFGWRSGRAEFETQMGDMRFLRITEF